MPQGVRTREHLEEVVDAYRQFDEIVIDVETLGDYRDDPQRNEIFWVNLAGPGRADIIPCGHPVGERIPIDPDDDTRRIKPNSRTHQEHRINPDSGRLKWFDIPEPFTAPPKQLWVGDVMAALKPLLFDRRIRKIGSGFKFDLETMTKYYGEVPPPPYGDTWVAARLINENWRGHGLKECVERQFEFTYDKAGKYLDRLPYSEAYQYCFFDARYSWLVWNDFIPMLDEEELRHIFDLEMDLMPVLIDMEMTGSPIDLVALQALHDSFELDLARMQLAINEVAGFEVNLNADAQVAEVVYDILGHECLDFTEKTGQRSTAKQSLERYEKDKTVALILEHAGLAKLQSTFVNGLMSRHLDGRIHPDYNQMGAVSGRLSCRNPNLQNQPSRSERGKQVRSVFVASPGYRLVVIDLSQIELRILAHFTQDPKLLRAYRENEDLHSMTAEVVFGPNFTDIQRSFAKNGNFSVLYGAGPHILVTKYKVKNLRIAKSILQGFYRTYRLVKPWKQTILHRARKRFKRNTTPPYVMTILGRKRRLPGLLWADDGKRAAAERQAISVTVSGTAADLFKVIMIECHHELAEANLGARILNQIHDELVIEAPRENAEKVLKIVTDVMENVRNPFTGEPFLSVPIVADGRIVNRWSDKVLDEEHERTYASSR